MTANLIFPIEHRSHVSEARRAAVRMAADQNFDEVKKGEISIVATELATNILKHAKSGVLLIRRLDYPYSSGVELLAIDRGPGIADIGKALQDGYSTSGSQGTGLGAIYRLSTVFDLYSEADKGTVILSRMLQSETAVQQAYLLGAISVPPPNEQLCGDGWLVRANNGRLELLVADGLGHGLAAHDASQMAIEAFSALPDKGLEEYIRDLHAALRGSRGAALVVARIAERKVFYCGVGNISGSIISEEMVRHLVSHNGIIGHEVRKVREFQYEFPESGVLVLHSDGIATSWDRQKYPGILRKDPALIAAVLYRDFARPKDDATIVVIKRATSL